MTNDTDVTQGRSERAAPGRSLLVFAGASVAEHALPEEGTLVIGRGRDADLRIEDPTLSREHARLVLGAHVTVEDRGSRNGTRVGGHALRAGEPVLVAPGSAIEIGDVLLVLRGASSTADLLASTDASREGGAALERAIERVARAPISVLVAGEGGAGKMFVATRIHDASGRRGALVVLACSPSTGVHEVARSVEAAHHGTLVVREPTRLTPPARAALESSLAGARGRADVGVIAIAAKGDIPDMLRARLGAVTIVVPPLRARLRELPRLVSEMVAEISAERGTPPPVVGSMALARLGRHAWPGNLRELRDVLVDATERARGRVIGEREIEIRAPASANAPGTLDDAVADAERTRILEALRGCDGNQTRAAKMLGISRGTLISRLERYAMPRPRK